MDNIFLRYTICNEHRMENVHSIYHTIWRINYCYHFAYICFFILPFNISI